MTRPAAERSYRLDVPRDAPPQSGLPDNARRPIFVALSGRSRLLLEGLRNRLVAEADFHVCGLTSEVESAAVSLSNRPEVVVLELCGSQSAEESQARMQRRFPEARLVRLHTDHRTVPDTGLPFQISACDSLDQCVAVIRHAAGRPAADADANGESERLLQSLNPRQLQIFALLAGGDSVKEVACAMGLTFKTVDSQKYRLMRKLGITDRVQATRLAIRAGLLNP